MFKSISYRGRITFMLSVALFSMCAFAAPRAFADSIDYISANISPAANFNGGSGNFTLINSVSGGSAITFDLKFQINTSGGTTTYPRTVAFGVTDITKPAGAADPSVSGLAGHTFTSAASTFTDTVTITAPDDPGAYSVKIAPTSGTGGSRGLSPGGGIVISFTVEDLCAPADTAINVSLDNNCILYHASSAVFTATLTSGGSPVAGETVDFYVDGVLAGSKYTDASGVAALTYDPSSLPAGDHSVVASFQGVICNYNGISASATLGVQYLFIGFQQPVNADGTSMFGGRTIPVKIRIADAYGNPVPEADAHVFFAYGTPAIIGTDAEPVANTNGDSGNTMRYVAADDHYIFNWDIAGLANGTYTVRVGLGEGTCAGAHTVLVTLRKKGSK